MSSVASMVVMAVVVKAVAAVVMMVHKDKPAVAPGKDGGQEGQGQDVAEALHEELLLDGGRSRAAAYPGMT